MFSPVNSLWYSDALHVEGTLMGLVEFSSNLPDMETNSECPKPFDTMSRSIDSRHGAVKGAGCTNVRQKAAGVQWEEDVDEADTYQRKTLSIFLQNHVS